MRFDCRQIQYALISGDPLLDHDTILAHLEGCARCQETLELPEEISREIGNINLLPASLDIYDNVMANLTYEKFAHRMLRRIKMARIGLILTVYAGLILMVALYRGAITRYARDIISGFPQAFDINLSDIATQAEAILKIVKDVSQSPPLIVAVLMSVTLIWALVIVRLRDTLRN
ncbi:MAG: hypothetical protein A2W25_16610 [candidate division Zixibacteria bacterium RBG_16_53_22]|nr:MAG: hypothetical protein A2W25_16610 [candidate division Zixibacteria bacterium RBG_16_53_22]